MNRKYIILTALLALLSIIIIARFLFPNTALAPKNGNPQDNATPVTRSNIVYGFLPFWMIDNSKYIQLDKLTHIAYFSLKVDGEGNIIQLNEDGTSELGYLNWRKNTKLDNLISKAKGENVRVALTLTASSEENTEQFLACPSCWDTLIQNTITQLQFKNITDVNLDFEYPGIAPSSVRNGYSQFAEHFTNSIHHQIPGSIVVVSTYANSAYRTRLHDISKLTDAVDYIFIMAYDFHLLTDLKTGPVAPLGGAPDTYPYDVTTMLNDYLRFSPSNKLILGVAYYGYDWITENDKLGSIRIPGRDDIGLSHVSYYGSCEYHPQNVGGNKKWDEESNTPWFSYIDEETGVNRQCHYENAESLSKKYEFAKNNNMAGIGIWALGYDGEHQELWDLLK